MSLPEDIQGTWSSGTFLKTSSPETLLIQFVECDTGISGHALADKMTSVISLLGLDLQNLRGQGYDGAGNVSGKKNGAATIISFLYPLAAYNHCASQMLNLAVMKGLDVPCVRSMIGVVNNERNLNTMLSCSLLEQSVTSSATTEKNFADWTLVMIFLCTWSPSISLTWFRISADVHLLVLWPYDPSKLYPQKLS